MKDAGHQFREQEKVNNGEWRIHAACRGMDSALWFPERGELTTVAKQVCFSCPVRTDCLEYALLNCEKQGVWGGISERGRRALRKERNSSRRVS